MHLPELDVMRGVAIVWVIWLHVYFSTWADSPRWEVLFLRGSHLLAHSAVPAFLYISGFLLARDHSPGFGTFVVRRLRRVMAPGALWMTFALAFEVWRGGGLTRDLLRAFALFDVSGQYYYLPVLAILTVAAYPIRHQSPRRLIAITAGAWIVGLAMVAWYQWYGGHALGGLFAVFAYRNPLIWAPFLLLGLTSAHARPDLRWSRRVVAAAALGMAALFAVYIYGGETRGYPISYFGVTVFAFSTLGMLVYPSLSRIALQARPTRPLARAFAWLAPYVFALYLVHKPFFVGWLSDRVVSDTALADDYLRLMLGLFVVGGASALLFVLAVDRLWPAARPWLGIEQPPIR